MQELQPLCFTKFELGEMPSDTRGYRIGCLLPKDFDPQKHQVVMIDHTIGECILYPDKETGVYYQAKETSKSEKEPVTRKYETEYKLYCEYCNSLPYPQEPDAYLMWEAHWKKQLPINRDAVLRAYAYRRDAMQRDKGFSLQEGCDDNALCFELYVSPKG